MRVCEQTFKPTYCVTGTILPCMMGGMGEYIDCCLFVDQVEDIDQFIRKVGKGHKHFLWPVDRERKREERNERLLTFWFTLISFLLSLIHSDL